MFNFFSKSYIYLLSNFRFSLSAQVEVVILFSCHLPVWTSLPSHTWSAGSCFSPAHFFCSVRHQLDCSKQKKKKTGSCWQFCSWCCPSSFQVLFNSPADFGIGKWGGEALLKSHPERKGWGQIMQRGSLQQAPHQLPLVHPFICLLSKEFRKKHAPKHCTTLWCMWCSHLRHRRGFRLQYF